MKNILFKTTILLVFSVNIAVYSQEKSFDTIVDLQLPKGLEYLDKQKQEALLKSRPKSKNYLKIINGNLYRMGNILLRVNASNKRVQNNAYGTNKTLLEDTKRFNDELTIQIPEQKNYTSEITTINNSKILIINYDMENAYSSYIIQAVNEDNNKTIAISIEYDKKDEAKTKKIVEHILKNMKFK